MCVSFVNGKDFINSSQNRKLQTTLRGKKNFEKVTLNEKSYDFLADDTKFWKAKFTGINICLSRNHNIPSRSIYSYIEWQHKQASYWTYQS